MEKQIFIIRHGETEYNRRRIVQGSGIDSDLNGLGQAQAHAFFEHYGSHSFDLVLTSRLKRTHQTVEPFLQRGLPWEQFEELNEISWGDLDGSPSTPELISIYKEVVGEWQRGNFSARHGNGESAEEMGERLQRFITHLRQRPEKQILICSHGRAIRAMICLMLEKSMREMEAFGHANTGLYRLGFRDQTFHLELENDTRHLQAVES